jgi:hypothetical protein
MLVPCEWTTEKEAADQPVRKSRSNRKNNDAHRMKPIQALDFQGARRLSRPPRASPAAEKSAAG